MNKILFSLFLTAVFLFPLRSNGQKIHFAKKLGENVNQFTSSNEFSVPDEGIFIAVILDLKEDVESENVYINFYKEADDQSDKPFSSEKKQYGEDKIIFWKRFSQDQSGIYYVKVFDDMKRLLCSGEVNLVSEKETPQFPDNSK